MKETIVHSAGMLVALMVAHVIGDWMFQSYKVATTKTSNAGVRAWHCLLYSVPVGALVFLVMPPVQGAIAMAWVYLTHFVIDTYMPLYYFRKAMGDPAAESVESYKKAFETPHGFYIGVTLDQIFHFLTLVPVAVWMALT